MNKIIIVKNLTKIYEDKVPTLALDNINLEIEDGYVYSIYGQSGSGKTTLLNMLGCLDSPTSGEIIIDNQNINNLDQKELADFRNKKIGFIFQFHYLIPEFNILENILMPFYISKSKIKNVNEAKSKAIELAKITDIEDILFKYPDYVSGGQRQRAAICRALINEPKIVLADEPTGNLDSKNTEIIINLFMKINKIKKTTFLIVTHNEKIANNCKEKIELRDGKIFNITKNY
ncbi:MAG: lipoprotein-releasing system ATP-binding protein LolD [Candidatus Parcubacteria bacterium]|nr:MAG: lipoprotein-releasing system ATP-binding protein LolD [Candidatus Parcubacteria bacterium]